jgi:hypothetical protein
MGEEYYIITHRWLNGKNARVQIIYFISEDEQEAAKQRCARVGAQRPDLRELQKTVARSRGQKPLVRV